MSYFVRYVAVSALILLIAGGCRLLPSLRPATVRITAVTSIWGNGGGQGEPFGILFRNDSIFYSDGRDGSINRVDLSQTGEIFQVATNLSTPSQIAFDDKGRILIADTGSHTIKRLTPAEGKSDGKNLELLAGVEKKSGNSDGDAKSASFRGPIGIAFGDGKIYVADTYNDRIRVIDDAGRVSTLAGSARGFADGTGSQAMFDTPCGLAFDAGKLYVADAGNRRIRVIDVAGGTVSTLAGNGLGERIDGAPANASFVFPVSVAVAPDSSLLIADGNAIRMYLPAKPAKDEKTPSVEASVSTVAGDKRGHAHGSPRDARFSRPSGIAVDSKGIVFVADSENGDIRVGTDGVNFTAPSEVMQNRPPKAEEFRAAAPARWPYDPPTNKREIAGTLGEVRGEMKEGSDEVWFHNGLDVVGGYGETSRFVRSEKVLRPISAENFGTLRELVRMPTMGYIHIRLGRDQNEKPYDDDRFIFDRDASGKIVGVRIPRGAEFKAGEPIGTLNPMNHTHLIAGPSGFEMNALAALELPGVSDKIAPVIEQSAFYDENWKPFETAKPNSRINLRGKVRIVVKAYDRMDGNAERRRLGVYEVGYQLLKNDGTAVGEAKTSIKFDRLPEPDAVFLVYANGSKSGATGETIFRYIATNEVHGDVAREGFLDVSAIPAGEYVIRLTAGDFFGNKATKDVTVTIN